MISAQAGHPQWKVQHLIQLLGLRWQGLPAALVLSTILTAALFLGPIALMALRWRSDTAFAPQLDRTLLQVRCQYQQPEEGSSMMKCVMETLCINISSMHGASLLTFHVKASSRLQYQWDSAA